MPEKYKLTNWLGPRSLLAIVLMTLIGALAGSVSFLSYKYLSVATYLKYDAIAAIESYETPSNPNTSGDPYKIEWITYRNDNHGFSFRHPADWRITEDIFSENFVLVATNKTYSSEAYGEIRIEKLKEAAPADASDLEDDSDPVYTYNTTFSHSIDLAGKEKKELVRFNYAEMDRNGETIPKDNWQYFDLNKKILESFEFIRK